jgi:hypothetical protein
MQTTIYRPFSRLLLIAVCVNLRADSTTGSLVFTTRLALRLLLLGLLVRKRLQQHASLGQLAGIIVPGQLSRSQLTDGLALGRLVVRRLF